MLTCAISDRHLFTGTEPARQATLAAHLRRLSATGPPPHRPLSFFQLREKDLPPADLGRLLDTLRSSLAAGSPTRLLLNGPPALAATHGAHGVHLSSGWSAASVADARAALSRPSTITASAHTLAEAALAPAAGLDAVLFGPVFEKSVRGTPVLPGTGLALLAQACVAASPVPVLALGGVTLANAPRCLAAGAAGIAGIRLFLP